MVATLGKCWSPLTARCRLEWGPHNWRLWYESVFWAVASGACDVEGGECSARSGHGLETPTGGGGFCARFDGKHVLLQLVGFILTEKCWADWIPWGMAWSENGHIGLLFGVNSCSVASAVGPLTETPDPVTCSDTLTGRAHAVL